MVVAVAWVVFKERGMSLRDGIILVAVTEASVVGLIVPHALPLWVVIFCNVVMWSIVSSNVAGNASRRLGERLKKRDGCAPR